ncbi:MAG: S8 family serine peptidase, partial [Actinomadura sp.]
PCPPQSFDKAGSPASEIRELWAQQKLNFEDAWQFTRGEGVKVAVIDSGVDSTHPQLSNVKQTLDETGTGPQDCIGHGTKVAGIIGAQDVRSSKQIPFFGVAPGAEIISIKFAVSSDNNDSSLVPKAIRKAVDLGAKVINLSIQGPASADLLSAVRYAHSRDVVIVAAAGNLSGTPGDEPQPVYPAEYENGVISVGAIGPDGQLAEDVSNTVTRVDLTAPGKDIISTFPQPRGSYGGDTGTSFAVPYVAGTAALVRAHNPTWTYLQVRQAIIGTADGGTVKGTGAGLVNPLRAVTSPLSATGGKVPPAPASGRRVPILQPEPEDRFGRLLALSITGGALTVALVVAVICVVVPEGRRRGWQPNRRTTPRPPAA